MKRAFAFFFGAASVLFLVGLAEAVQSAFAVGLGAVSRLVCQYLLSLGTFLVPRLSYSACMMCGTAHYLLSPYWYPIYTYVRRKGHNADDAQDLTQEFFSQVIAKQHLRLADPLRGRFRSFLLASLDYFLAREWSRAHLQKRGGQYQFVSLDEELSEAVPQFEAIDGENPEKTFRRQWALAVLKQTMDALENECATLQKARLFGEVKHLLSGERDGETYAAIGARLSMTESNVRVAVHRLRRRYGDLLRAEIARTVDSDDEVEEELRYLLQALCE